MVVSWCQSSPKAAGSVEGCNKANPVVNGWGKRKKKISSCSVCVHFLEQRLLLSCRDGSCSPACSRALSSSHHVATGTTPKPLTLLGSRCTGNWQHQQGTGKNPINLSPAQGPAPIPTQARAMGSFGFFCKRSSSKVLALFAAHPHREAGGEHEEPRALPALQQENAPGKPLGDNKFESRVDNELSTSPVPLLFTSTSSRKLLLTLEHFWHHQRLEPHHGLGWKGL